MNASLCQNLGWLERYAIHCRIILDPGLPLSTAIRNCFPAPAWRVLCRSPKSSFQPILRNRSLCFRGLVDYVQALAAHSFQVAPKGDVLSHFIRSSYLFFDCIPSAPIKTEQMILMRLASKHGRVTARQMQRVHEWAGREGLVSTRMTWLSVVRRADAWYARLQAERTQEVWAFACRDIDWRGLKIFPLTDSAALWDEGKAMANCLFSLRSECSSSRSSRFFSVHRRDRRYATLELVLMQPHITMHGPDRIYGRWQLQDCRLSFNRLPPLSLLDPLRSFAWQYNNLAQRPSRRPRA